MNDKSEEAASRRKARDGQNRSHAASASEPAAPAPAADARLPADREPPDGVKALALDYPFALLAGGLAVGVLIGALLPRRQTSRLSGPLLAAAGAAGEFGLAYARKSLDRAASATHEAAAEGGKLIEAAGQRVEHLAEGVAEAAPGAIRDSGRRLARSVVRLTSQLRH